MELSDDELRLIELYLDARLNQEELTDIRIKIMKYLDEVHPTRYKWGSASGKDFRPNMD